MGLDVVELVLEIEDAFGISIADEEANKAVTVGDVIHLVKMKLGTRESGQCASGSAFYTLRRALVDGAQIPRSAIRPDSLWTDLADESRLKSIWKLLESKGMKLPRLRLSATQETFFFASVAIVGAIVGLLTRSFFGGLFVFMLLLVPVRIFLSRIASKPHASCSTIGRSAIVLAAGHPQSQGALSEAEIAGLVRAIISEELAIPLERVKDEAHIVKDLGAG